MIRYNKYDMINGYMYLYYVIISKYVLDQYVTHIGKLRLMSLGLG